jgi:hypothetical protein
MSGMVEHVSDTAVDNVTVGGLREVLSGLADDTPLHLGVVDHQHFNTLLGTMPITSARMMAHYGGATLILHLPTS